MSQNNTKYPIGGQSPALKFPAVYEESWLQDKTILVTGGASGFGEAFVRKWAAAGACVVFGDVDVARAEALVGELRGQAGRNVHFIQCDVTSWAAQVNLFKEAINLSPHGGIDSVIVNAGIADSKAQFENPDPGANDPSVPNLDVINITLIGAMYTTHLALFYLPRNPGSAPANAKNSLVDRRRDRHVLLIGSVASIMPLPRQALYGAAKHGVLGLYRSLRTTSFTYGVRVNLICPYFVNTPLITARTRALVLANAALGTVEDVVEAATMFTADSSIVGRAVVIGPKLRVSQAEDGLLEVSKESQDDERGIWEIYAHDFEDCEIYSRNIIRLLNRAAEAKGWIGWAGELINITRYGISTWWTGKRR